MRLKVIATGEATGTRIVDARTGEDLSRSVRSVRFSHEAGEDPVLVVEFIDFEAEIEGEALVETTVLGSPFRTYLRVGAEPGQGGP